MLENGASASGANASSRRPAITGPDAMQGRRDLRVPVASAPPLSADAFQRSMSGLFGSNLLDGNRVETLLNGDTIFGAMLDAIRAAESTVNFETYVYWAGVIGRAFADALMERARNGVEVRVLLDWIGSQAMDRRLVAEMRQAGVRVVRFRPLHWYRLDQLNNRTHRKLLVVDGTLGFTGGVGIGDEWRGNARNPTEWRENHYRIAGPVVAMLQGAFAANWVEETGEILQGDRFFPELEPAGQSIAQVVISGTVNRNVMHRMLMTAIASAAQCIRIETPYFIPDAIAIDQLLQARARGVEVRLILPNAYTNKRTVRRASRHFWGPLLKAGVRIHEFQPTFMHAKLLIVDDRFASVGSANFDERSFRRDDEANLNVFDEGFAREQIEVFERDLAASREVTLVDWQRRTAWEKTVDWAASLLRSQL